MSCPQELTLAFYLDDELEPEEVRRLEAHLIGCRRCRERVVDLEDEARLLADVLHERPAPALRPAPAAPPAHALAGFLIPTAGLGAVALAVAAWLVEAGLPSGLAWLSPLHAERIHTMAIDLAFWLRGDAPQLLRLLGSFAALGTVAVLLLGLVSLAGRRLARGPGAFFVALVCLLCGLAPGPAAALDVRRGEEDVTIAAGETLSETLVATADTVRVDGAVEGDLVVMSDRLILRGEVRGDVYAASRTVEISGRVTGNLHAMSEKLRLDGRVQGDHVTFARLVTLAPGSRVGRDVTHFGYGLSAEGEVGRDLFGAGDWIELRGRVGRDVQAHADRVALLEGARVEGDVAAVFWQEPVEVERAPGASVEGAVEASLYEHAARSRLEKWSEIGFHVALVLRFGASFALGMLLYALFPGLFAFRAATAGDFFRAFGMGFLAFLAAPVALALVGVTLVGIPIALLGAAVYLAALYVGEIVVAMLVGGALTRARPLVPAQRPGWGSFAIALGAGLLLVILASELPYLGWPFQAVVVLTGLGLLVERALSAWRGRGAGAAP